MNKYEDYERFFNEAPVGLYKTRQSDGLFMAINFYGAKFLGFDHPEDLIGKVKATDFYSESSRAELLEKLHDCDDQISDYELELQTRTGEKVWVSMTARNGDDHILGSFTDITARKKLEDQILVYRSQQSALLTEMRKDVRRRLALLE